MDCRILIADDNTDAGDTLGAFLEALGFEVQVVRDGQAAVECVAERMPQIVILDLGMPRLDGWRACERIRALPGGGGARIVALSGWGASDARAKSKEAGFDEHRTKPASTTELFALIRRR